jgi:hypothetical protein
MGLFHHSHSSISSSSSNGTSGPSTCATIPLSDYHANPVAGTWTLHTVMIVTSAVLTGIILVVGTFICFMHFANYTNPKQQRQLARVAFMPAVFALFSFFCIWFYDEQGYLVPVADLYESFALVGIFYYIINVVTPDESKRLSFFRGLKINDKKGSNIFPRDSVDWLFVRVVVKSTTA